MVKYWDQLILSISGIEQNDIMNIHINDDNLNLSRNNVAIDEQSNNMNNINNNANNIATKSETDQVKIICNI